MQTARLAYRRSAVAALLIVSFGIGVVVGRAWPSGGASPGDVSALIDRIADWSPSTDTSSLSRTWELIQSRFVNRPVEST
ncbi:MAG: hypothetical protein HY421_00045, partial [Candidatus Kerfeldbacteria bacterium]|nr:hypothetical protein [Candidatus Kerfeldbacteria bacterium]